MDCNIGKLVEAREEINAAARRQDASRPTSSPSMIVIKALAIALQRIPTPMSAGPTAAC